MKTGLKSDIKNYFFFQFLKRKENAKEKMKISWKNAECKKKKKKKKKKVF